MARGEIDRSEEAGAEATVTSEMQTDPHTGYKCTGRRDSEPIQLACRAQSGSLALSVCIQLEMG